MSVAVWDGLQLARWVWLLLGRGKQGPHGESCKPVDKAKKANKTKKIKKIKKTKTQIRVATWNLGTLNKRNAKYSLSR